MKVWYDNDARDKVLVFLSAPCHPLQSRYYSPYENESRFSDVKYIFKTPDRRRETRVCHIYMLKEYLIDVSEIL